MASIRPAITDLDDLLISIAGGGSIQGGNATATTEAVADASFDTISTLVRDAGDFDTNFNVGDFVQITGAAISANNVIAEITSIAALTLTFASAPFTVDTTNATITVTLVNDITVTCSEAHGLTEEATFTDTVADFSSTSTIDFPETGISAGDVLTVVYSSGAQPNEGVTFEVLTAAAGVITATENVFTAEGTNDLTVTLVRRTFATITGTTNYNERYIVKDSTTTTSTVFVVCAAVADNNNTGAESVGAVIGDDNGGKFFTPEVVINATDKIIQLLNAGNLSTLGSGVAGQALYSFFKERWKEVPGLTRFDFPMLSITNEQFEFINGFRLADETTRKLIRTAGWAERSADNSTILQEYSGIITLGSLGTTDQPYFVQNSATDADTINTDFTGPVNEAVRIGATANFGASTLTFNATLGTIVASAGDFSDFSIGDTIRVEGSAANNKTFLVSNISQTTNPNDTLTIDEANSNDVTDAAPDTNAIKISNNKRSIFKIFVRERAKSYGDADLNDIGVTLMTYIVYRFPVSNATDLNINTTSDNALYGLSLGAAGADGTDHTFYSLTAQYSDLTFNGTTNVISDGTATDLNKFQVGTVIRIEGATETTANNNQEYIVADTTAGTITVSGNTLNTTAAAPETANIVVPHGLYVGAPVRIEGFGNNFDQTGSVKEVTDIRTFTISNATAETDVAGAAPSPAEAGTVTADYVNNMKVYYFDDIYQTPALRILGPWNTNQLDPASTQESSVSVVVNFDVTANTITAVTPGDLDPFMAVGYSVDISAAVSNDGQYLIASFDEATETITFDSSTPLPGASDPADTVTIEFFYNVNEVVQDTRSALTEANKTWFRTSTAGVSSTGPRSEASFAGSGTDDGAIVWEEYIVRTVDETTGAATSNFGGGAEVESDQFSAYQVVIDANTNSLTAPGATKEIVYEWAQWLLRKTNSIDTIPAGSSFTPARKGSISDVLCNFVGDNLNTTQSVYVDNIANTDANLITFFDYLNSSHVFPTVVTVTINFNSNLSSDGDAVFYAYYTTLSSGNNFGTNNAVQVNQSNNTKVGVEISNNVPNDGEYVFSYSYTTDNADGSRTVPATQNITVVSIGLITGQYVKASSDITTAGATVSLVAPLERNYTNPA